MGYIKIYSNWLPYAQMTDKRGFISRIYGGGHSGVDSVGNQFGNPVCAVINGKVTAVYTSITLGKVVEYTSGIVRIAHYHMASTEVTVGQAVTAGKTILGVEGSTGTLATGKHLHTSMWLFGVLTDPEPYMSGSKELPKNTSIGGNIMIRKVTAKGLNLRVAAGVWNSTVYASMPVGTILICGDTKTVNGATWAQVCTTINGKQYVGWSNISDTWSKGV